MRGHCWLVASCPSNMLVCLTDGSAQTVGLAAKLREKYTPSQWGSSFRSNLWSCSVTVYWHRANSLAEQPPPILHQPSGRTASTNPTTPTIWQNSLHQSYNTNHLAEQPPPILQHQPSGRTASTNPTTTIWQNSLQTTNPTTPTIWQNSLHQSYNTNHLAEQPPPILQHQPSDRTASTNPTTPTIWQNSLHQSYNTNHLAEQPPPILQHQPSDRTASTNPTTPTIWQNSLQTTNPTTPTIWQNSLQTTNPTTPTIWQNSLQTTNPTTPTICCSCDRLAGLVVKASASRAEDPGFESRLWQDFSRSSHTGDLKIGTPVATLPGTWHHKVSAGTGWGGKFDLQLLSQCGSM